MDALFVSHTAEMGGAEIFLCDIIESGPRNWGACFLSPGEAIEHLTAIGRPPISLMAGSKVLSVRRSSSVGALVGAVCGVLSLARELARAAKDYRVFVANSQKSLFVCALASRLARRKLVWILHDILGQTQFSTANRRAAVFFANTFAARVIVNSQETGRSFIEAGGQADRVRIVYNGFRPESRIRSDPAFRFKLREEFGLGSGPVVVLFGRRTEWKGQHVLLRALVDLPEVQALIVGGPLFGCEAYEAEIKRLAETLGLAHRVRFTGFRKDMAELMAGVDAVVHASIEAEPFGRVLVEGMLAERPVIATRAGGVTEIVEDGVTGLLVAPGDPADLARAIRQVTGDADFAERLARTGRKRATERFSIEATCEALATVLDEVGCWTNIGHGRISGQKAT